MPTIIDALVMTLALDASAFTKGQKEAVSSLGKTKEATVKAGKEMEGAAAGMTSAFGKATEGILELSAAFLGFRGFKEMIANIDKTDTALGNFSDSLASSPQLVSAWGIAASRLGGSAQQTYASLRSLSDALIDLKSQGKNLPIEFYLLTGGKVDPRQSWDKVALGIAKAASEMAKTDPAKANRFLRALGLDPATSAMMIKMGPQLAAYVDAQKKLTPTDRDIQAAKAMTDAQVQLNAEWSKLGSAIMAAVAPALIKLANVLSKVIDAVADWAEKNPEAVEAIGAFIAVVGGAAFAAGITAVIGLAAALTGLVGIGVGTGAFAALLGAGLVLGAGAAALIGGGPGTKEGDADEPSYGDAKAGRTSHAGGRAGGGGDGGDVAHGGSNAHNLTDLITRESAAAAGGNAAEAAYIRQHLEGIRAGESLHKQNWYDKKDDAVESSWGPFQLNRRRGLGVEFEKETGLDLRDKRTIPAQVRWVAKYIKNRRPMRAWTSWASHGPQEANPRWGDAGYAPTPDAKDQQPAVVAASGKPMLPLAKPNASHITRDVQWWHGLPQGWKPTPLHGHLFNAGGAAHSAALNNISNDNRASTTSSSNEMHINGGIHVNAPRATDAHGISREIKTAMADNMFANYANYGPN